MNMLTGFMADLILLQDSLQFTGVYNIYSCKQPPTLSYKITFICHVWVLDPHQANAALCSVMQHLQNY